MEPCGSLHILGKREIDYSPPDAAVAVFEWVNGFKPDVSDTRAQQAIFRTVSTPIEPIEKGVHLGGYRGGGRCYVVDALLPEWPAHNLHWALMGAVATRLDLA